MSTLNLGLQGVALKRNQISSESETLFNVTNILDDIAQEFSDLEFELKESITDVQNLLKNQTERFLIKDKKLKYHNPTTKEEIAKLFKVKFIILFIYFLFLFYFYTYTNIFTFHIV